ncbi:hypothetical protein ADL29_22130 [Streptomyces chattanoogensis]|uniref:Uncharacterized protein n=1 Tax=Streptomyces chattanoogensis TaxID=66876 RepID=A0A0N0GYJ3_9ACTN|nr:hypothetical protein ADL29_22130 [Streptomyces chattanoogensis]
MRTKVSKSKIAALAEDVEKHWKAKGYELESRNRKMPSFRYSTPEGVSVVFDVGGDLVTISASISDTKSPGRSGDIDKGDFPHGLKDIAPDVRDPYWSK